MARKKHSAEQIVTVLRQIEVELPNQKSTGQACKEAGITEQTYYHWRKEYGGLKLEQAKRLKELEKENSRLRRLMTELSLDKQVLKDAAEGTFSPSRRQMRSYLPARFPQQHRDAAITVAAILAGQRDNSSGQSIFLVPLCRLVALRAPGLIYQLARSPPTDPMPFPRMAHRTTSRFRA